MRPPEHLTVPAGFCFGSFGWLADTIKYQSPVRDPHRWLTVLGWRDRYGGTRNRSVRYWHPLLLSVRGAGHANQPANQNGPCE